MLSGSPPHPILELQDIDSHYGEMEVLRRASLSVGKGEVVALFGPNGHGKSTLLKVIAGLHSATSGSIIFSGKDVTSLPGKAIVQLGMVLIPEDRHLFTEMTVQENLLLGAFNRRARKRIKENFELVYSLFPRLAERGKQQAGTLSGGESRMLTIGRGLMSDASVLLIDEPSIGLSPLMKKTVFGAIATIKVETDFSVLIVEQEVDYPLGVADRAYVLNKGRVIMERKAEGLTKAEIEQAYF